MERRDFLRLSILAPLGGVLAACGARASAQTATRKILIAGGNYGTPFVRYMGSIAQPSTATCSLNAAASPFANAALTARSFAMIVFSACASCAAA